MTTQAEQEARLKRIAEAYVGSPDIGALLNSTVWKSELSKANGNVNLAASRLGIKTETGKTLHGWFLEGKSGTSRKGEEYAFSKVLLSNGQVRSFSGTDLGLSFLAPVTVSNVTVKTNIGNGTTQFVTKDATVTEGGHTDTPVLPTFAQALKEARQPARFGNKKLRANKVAGVGGGTIINEDGARIFVDNPTDWHNGQVSFLVEDDDGARVRVTLSAERFEEEFGIRPDDDFDTTNSALAGQKTIFYGEFDTTGKLNDALEAEFVEQLTALTQNHVTINDKGYPELGQPVPLFRSVTEDGQTRQVEALTVQNVSRNKEGAYSFYADVSELGYTPSVRVEPQTSKDGTVRDWTTAYAIQFVNHSPGDVIIPAAYQGVDELLSKYMTEEELV